MAPRVTLITRTACHLCDEARELVAQVCAEEDVEFAEVDVDSDPIARAEHGDFVPVVLVDGIRRGFWAIDAETLRAALV
jgi:glutaredoxin